MWAQKVISGASDLWCRVGVRNSDSNSAASARTDSTALSGRLTSESSSTGSLSEDEWKQEAEALLVEGPEIRQCLCSDLMPREIANLFHLCRSHPSVRAQDKIGGEQQQRRHSRSCSRYSSECVNVAVVAVKRLTSNDSLWTSKQPFISPRVEKVG